MLFISSAALHFGELSPECSTQTSVLCAEVAAAGTGATKTEKKALATTPYLTSIHADSLQNCMSSLRVLANDCECILANGHGPFRATVATPRLERHTSRYARERLTPKIKRVLEDQNDEFITCVYIPSHPIHNNNNNKSNNNEHEQFYRMGVRIVIVYSQMMCVCAVQCDA